MHNLYHRLKGVVFLLLLPFFIFAQDKTITGTLVDANAKPIIGATISVKQSTSLGTVTDADGRFKLSVPANSTVVVSYIGFKSMTISAADITADAQLTMEEDVAHLDEVIVTGLATTVKRRNLANAVGTISAEELNGIAPAQTFDAALEGKITGANIIANSGAPGGGISVKLRGVTSVYGNTQPLYVVDGVEVDNSATSGGLNTVTNALKGGGPTSIQDNPSSRIADINPDDIENIEILKGASAAASYGSKAAAGVVIITTKKGTPGKTKITVSQDLGLVSASKLLGVRTFSDAALAADPAASPTFIQAYDQAVAAGMPMHDYEKEIYGHVGFTRNTRLSISGGDAKTTFYFAGGVKNEQGIVQNTGYNNVSARLNVEHKVNDRIKIGLNSNYINSSSDRGLFGNDNAGITTGIALSSTPGFAQLGPDANGIYPNNPFAAANPLQTIALMKNNERVNRFITGAYLEAILQKSDKSITKIVGRGGVDFYNLTTNVLFPSELQFQAVNKGTSIQGLTNNLNANYTASLVNTFTPTDKISLTSSGGFTQEFGKYNNVLDIATQLISGQSNINQAGALTATQVRTQYQNNGIYIQEEANLYDIVTLTAGVRFDQSTNNGNGNKYYAYPKAGISWDLMHTGIKSNVFDNIKLRAAYGQANSVPAYGSKSTSFAISNISGNTGLLVGTQEGEAGIQSERQAEFETGIDFSLLKGRLGFELTYYNKTVYNFLMLQSLPASSGFTNAWVNAGDLRNQGFEFGMNAIPVKSKVVTWHTNLSFWLNRSKVTRLSIPAIPQGSFGYVIGSYQIEQGKSATQIVGLNGAGVGVLGDAEPIFQMSTYNDFTFFGHLSLRFLLHWKYGGQNINLTSLQNDFGGTSANFDKVTNPAHLPDGFYHITQVGVNAQQTVENSSYMKLREIGLYYSFTNITTKYLKTITIGVSLHNYLTITKYRGYDPEVSNFGTGFSQGVDVDPYPASKHADFHISFDF